jgi:hypothetical protein
MRPPLQIVKLSVFRSKRNYISTALRAALANLAVIAALALFAFAVEGVTITTASLPNAVVDTAYSGTVTANHGCTPYKWNISSGSLPAGLTAQVSSSTKSYTISGTPTATGDDTFTVSVEGCGGRTSQESYTVQIQQASEAVDLSWVASSSPDITGYNVYRGTVSGGPYAKINSGGLVASTTYSDTTVATNTTYYYVTTAVNSSNEQSGYSNQVTAPVP